MRLGFNAYARPAPIPKMPEGLVELMEGLSREVLKNNPAETEVYAFCANHMKKLLDIRDTVEGKKIKKLSLEEKIARVQEKLRQDAVQRRKREAPPYIEPGLHDEATTSHQVEETEVEEVTEAIEQTCEDLSEITKLVDLSLPKNNASLDRGDDINDVAGNETKEVSVEEIQVLTDAQVEASGDDNVPAIDTSTETNNPNDSAEHLPPEEIDAHLIQSDAVVEAENQSQELIKMKDVELEMDITNYKIRNSDMNVETQGQEQEEKALIGENYENRDVGSGPVINIIDIEDKISEKNIEIHINGKDSEKNTESIGEESGLLKVTEDDVQYKNQEKQNILVSESDTSANTEPTLKEREMPDDIKESSSTKSDMFDGAKSDALNTGTGPEVIEIMTQKTVQQLSAPVDTSECLAEDLIDIEAKTKEIIKQETETSEEQEPPLNENMKSEENNVQDAMIENKDFKETGDSMTPVSNDEINKEIEMIQLSKTPEILDEDSLKESEISIVAKASDHENLVPTACEEVNETDNLNKSQVEKDLNSDSAQKIEIDINKIAKSDSTHDLVNEETINESVSETTTAEEPDETPAKNSGMDLETAAVTIQKVFRNFLFKSRQSTLDDVSNEEGSIDVADDILAHEAVDVLKTEDELHSTNIRERRTLGITRMESVLQTVNEEKSLSLSTDDSSLSSAATIIQAHVRGFLVRNKLHNKTSSTNSQSLEAENEPNKNKTVLNIHIVPEGGHFMSRDESMAMSLDLPYDGSPPTSSLYKLSLHPLSYDVSERRKLLKREDAIQSVSPPSNNSGKLSEDVDSVKDMTIHENGNAKQSTGNEDANEIESQVSKDDTLDNRENDLASGDIKSTKSITEETLDAKQNTGNEDANEIESQVSKDDTLDNRENDPASGDTTSTKSVTEETLDAKQNSRNEDANEIESQVSKDETLDNKENDLASGDIKSTKSITEETLDAKQNTGNEDANEIESQVSKDDTLDNRENDPASGDTTSTKSVTEETLDAKQNSRNEDANEIESQVSKDDTLDNKENDPASGDTTPTKSVTGETVVEVLRGAEETPETPKTLERKRTLTKQSSDEMDVVTPFAASEQKSVSPEHSESSSKLLHSSEFHEPVLPTNVSRSDTSVARGE